MFLSWIDRNVDKFSQTDGANFHLVDPRYEDVLFKMLKTTRAEFETKVLTHAVLMAALLMYSDSRYFEKNGIKRSEGKVNGCRITQTFTHSKGFKITYIEGFLSKKQLNAFIGYELQGFPDELGIVKELEKYNTEKKKLCIPLLLIAALKSMSVEQVVWMLKESQPEFEVNHMRLRLSFIGGATYPIVWKKGLLYFVEGEVLELKPYMQTASRRLKIEKFYVRGPIHLDELIHRRLGIHMYSFGDQHVAGMSACPGKERSKMTIVQLIEETIEAHPDKTIDVFVEKIYSIPGVETPLTQDSYLEDVKKRFKESLKHDKSKSKYRNARFHYVDIRKTPIFELSRKLWERNLLSKEYSKLSKSQWTEKIYEETFSFVEQVIQFILSSYQDEKFAGDVLEKAKIANQLRNLRSDVSPNFGDSILHFFGKEMKERQKWLMGDWEIAKQVKKDNGDLETKFKSLREVNSRIISNMSIFQDLYTVGRMFRTYKESRHGYSSEPAKLVISFLGAVHTSRISRFLIAIAGFSTVQSTTSEIKYQDFQCLEMRSELPLFKYD